MNDLISALRLIIHGHVSVLYSANISSCSWSDTQHRLRTLKLRETYLIHLIVNVTVTRCLENLMPLLRHWIKLIHIVSATVRVCARKQIEQTAMLNDSMACPRRVNYVVVNNLFLFSRVNRVLILNLRLS